MSFSSARLGVGRTIMIESAWVTFVSLAWVLTESVLGTKSLKFVDGYKSLMASLVYELSNVTTRYLEQSTISKVVCAG